MPILAGIDEAGYGPSLGPLVVAASLWRVPAAKVDGCLWTQLGDCVRRAAGGGDWRLVVDDSKTAFDRHSGIHSLERTALAFVSASGGSCNHIHEYLASIGAAPDCGSALPWYRGEARELPLDRVRSKYEAAAERLRSTMKEATVECIGLPAQVVPEELYNQRVGATRNKAALLIEQVLRLIARAGELARGTDLVVRVDRLGGRSDYRPLLAAAFPERRLHVLEVTDTISRYRLADEHGDWLIEFTVDGDQQHLPIALASMIAKYTRELLMTRFNEFWRSLLPTLKPTAGYYTDAQRFLSDIAPVLPASGLQTAAFVRER